MSQLSPSRPRARSNVTVRIARPDDDSQIQRHNFYISADRSAQLKRVPSPLATTLIPYERHQNDQVRSAGRSPRSPYSPAPLTAGSSGSQNSSGTPASPSCQKGSTGDKTFDSIKAAASRHAILDRSREEAKSRARDERIQHMQARGMAGSASGPQLSTGDGTPSPRLQAMNSAPIQLQTDISAKRTASLDSTMSLSQSPSTAFQPPQLPPIEDPQAVDIPALIAAAGSPEAAIRKLLHEKHEAAKTNSQLWRLMKKQKGMMETLNKDLQKAVKDKDRYRRKLKEQLMSSASVSTMPGSAIRSSIADERDDSQSPDLSEPPEDVMGLGRMPSIRSEGTDDNLDTPSYTTSSFSSPTPASSMVSPMYVKPMAAPYADRNELRSPLRGPEMSQLKSPGVPEHRVPTGSPPALVTNDPMQQMHSPKKLMREDSDILNRTPKVSQMQGKGGFSAAKERTQSLARKGPPAPLDLSPQKASQMVDNSSSDYADSSGGSSNLERGRRKTRADDERDREAEMQEREEQDRIARREAEKLRLERLDRPPLERDKSMGNMSITSEGYSSPEEPGSPHIAQVQTYQSLNALNTQLKTPQDLEFAAELKKSMAQHSVSSPGLPISPRPAERPGTAPNPTLRNATFSTFPNTLPASPRNPSNLISPRAPKQPIPMPPQTPLTTASPHLTRAETYPNHARSEEPDTAATDMFDEDSITPLSNTLFSPAGPGPRTPGDIYKGFMTDQWPGLLLPPNALPSIYVRVDSSRLRPSRHSYMAPKTSQENPVFSLAIFARDDNAQLWRIEKTLLALTQLDAQLKSSSKFRMRLPDRALFQGHAPARIDARRSALGKYFDVMLDTPMDEQAASVVCAFLSSDAIGAEVKEYFQASHMPTGSSDSNEPVKPKPRKDGYLTKKGKNFGGWIARYFVCDGPTLKYFEAPGGAQLGAIKLQYASIGRQTAKSAQEELDEENQFRHAFLVLEPKKRDKQNYVKHVLCAESDEERDAWVKCLMQYVENPEESRRPLTARQLTAPDSPKSPRVHKSMNDIRRQDPQTSANSSEMQSQLRAVIYDNTTAADAPVMGGLTVANSPSPPLDDLEERMPNTPLPVISGPKNGMKIEDAGVWGNKRGPNVLTKEYKEKDHSRDQQKDKERKRSRFAFKGRSSTESTPRESMSQKEQGESPAPRAVFGAHLAEAVEFAAPTDVPVRLPAVVYRCIEYLHAHDAIHEEGIFRMSGSNLVIRGLKERFNSEGDVHLLAAGEQMYDIHAVASLLKLYLRELPSTILTRDLHLDFVSCLELDGKTKVEAFNILVNRLPAPNRELLENLTAFLREIVDNEATNKMNVRNVGIVFSPTLNIPAPLISLFVTDHGKIFGAPIDIASVESKLPQLLSSQPGSANGSRLTLDTEEARSGKMHLYPGQVTPSSDASFFSQLSGADYSTAQRMFKEQYDTAYTPPPMSAGIRGPPPAPIHVGGAMQHELSALPRKISEASEPPLSPIRLAHIHPSSQPHHSFHSMKFPNPPMATSSVPLPTQRGSTSSNALTSSPKSQHTVSSHSSTSTLTNGQHRESLASNSNTSRSASTTSGFGTGPAYSKNVLNNLNDIAISSSPLMGGTSPEFNRSGFSPHNSIGLGAIPSNANNPHFDPTQSGGRLESSLTAPQIGTTPGSSPLLNMQTSASGPVGGLNPYSPSMYSAKSAGSSGSAGTMGGAHTPNPYAPSHLNPYSPNAHAHADTSRNGSLGSGGSPNIADRTGSLGQRSISDTRTVSLSKENQAQADRTGSLGSLGSNKSGGSGKEEKEGFGRRLLRRQSGNFLVKAGFIDAEKSKGFVSGGGRDGVASPRDVKGGMGLGVSSPRTTEGLGVSSPRTTGGFGRRD